MVINSDARKHEYPAAAGTVITNGMSKGSIEIGTNVEDLILGATRDSNTAPKDAVGIHSSGSVSAVDTTVPQGCSRVKRQEKMHHYRRHNTEDFRQRRPKPNLSFTPRLMKTPVAADYLGVSATKLKGLPVTPRKDGGNILYDVNDLNAYADALPYETEEEVNTCDKLFE